MRFFNTTGPVRSANHYCLPPLERFDLAEVLMLIEQQKYFVLHAPRQTGKTTCLLALMEHLNQSQRYRCLYINVEVGQFAQDDATQALQAILGELGARALQILNDPFPQSIAADTLAQLGPGIALNQVLSLWAAQSPLPLVLLVDEIDSLVGDALIAVLRQLRAGYDKRPTYFPQSLILCGVRDVRDYRLHTNPGKVQVTGGSAFNIKAKSLRLGDFTLAEVEALYRQHTQATGQIFAPGVLEKVWELTQGQPWLVNALGYEACFEIPSGRERTVPITSELIAEAKERLILRRETHLDQLTDKLKEERVRRVIEPILTGEAQTTSLIQDDVEYVRDLGLISVVRQLRIANPIYQEVIPRDLSYTTQIGVAHETAWYVRADGQLDTAKLLTAFQQFFRENSEHWLERFQYKEAGPQLLLQAFLQRIVNGGGRIDREYGLGRKRTDLLITWPYANHTQRIVIELKLLRHSPERTLAEGIEQTWEYVDRCGADEGHLVIFDQSAKSWEEKIYQRQVEQRGRNLMVWGV